MNNFNDSSISSTFKNSVSESKKVLKNNYINKSDNDNKFKGVGTLRRIEIMKILLLNSKMANLPIEGLI